MMMLQFLAVALLVLGGSVKVKSRNYLPTDCEDIYCNNRRSPSGVYTIFPGGPTKPLHVYCDMVTAGGRWTVFLRRLDGSGQFFRSWASYKEGFGDVAGEYWLGLDNIRLLTLKKKNELRVDMENWWRRRAYARYSSFNIGSEYTGYRLQLGWFTGGTAGDSLRYHNSMKFTTFDRDQDRWSKNCAQHHLGGFWYNACHRANPTGMYERYLRIPIHSVNIRWASWRYGLSNLKAFSMKIRSVKYRCK